MSTHDALSALATTTLRLSAEVGDLKAEIKRIKAVNERLRRNLEASREAHADTKADVAALKAENGALRIEGAADFRRLRAFDLRPFARVNLDLLDEVHLVHACCGASVAMDPVDGCPNSDAFDLEDNR